MIAWDEELCRLLAERGFRVVRFDNRDTFVEEIAANATRASAKPAPAVAERCP